MIEHPEACTPSNESPPHGFSDLGDRILESAGSVVVLVATAEVALLATMVLVTSAAGDWSTPIPVALPAFWGGLAAALVAMTSAPQIRRWFLVPIAFVGLTAFFVGPEGLHAHRALVVAATLAALLTAVGRTGDHGRRPVMAAFVIGAAVGVVGALRVLNRLPEGPVEREAYVFQGLVPMGDALVWAWPPLLAVSAIALCKRRSARASVGLLFVPVVAAITVLTDVAVIPEGMNHGSVATALTLTGAVLLSFALIATATRQTPTERAPVPTS